MGKGTSTWGGRDSWGRMHGENGQSREVLGTHMLGKELREIETAREVHPRRGKAIKEGKDTKDVGEHGRPEA